MTNNRLLRDILVADACHDLGIAPINDVRHDVNRTLASLSPDESRKMRRRFRKLWRKFLKNSNVRLSEAYIKQMETGSPTPTKRAKTARKREVLRRVLVDVVRPKMDRTEKNSDSAK